MMNEVCKRMLDRIRREIASLKSEIESEKPKENNWLKHSTMKNPDFFEKKIKDEITDIITTEDAKKEQ